MGDDADLERLDDAALAALAYGRGAEGDATGRMLAERAARILASRRPTSPAGEATTAVTAPSAAPGRAAAADAQHPEDAGPYPDTADAYSDSDADARERRIGRRRVIVVTMLVVAALIAAVVVSLPREPDAFAVFTREATPHEAAYEQRLGETGDELFSGVRVLAELPLSAVAPPGHSATIDLVAFRTGAPRSAPSERLVCLAVFGADRLWSRTCLPEQDFVTGSITVEDAIDGALIAYEWGPDGQAGLRFTATGPATLDELATLDVPALDALAQLARTEASPLVRTIDRVARPNGLPEPLIGPAELARVDEAYILIGLVRRSRTPGGELEVCATATLLGIAAAPIDHRCVTATEFATSGLRTPPAEGLRPFVYAWNPDGTVSLEGLSRTP